MPDKSALEERLKELKEEYARTPYNKNTNIYLGLLRKKISKVRKTLLERKRRKGKGFAVKKTGNATVVLVGFPNAGKSSLLDKLTNAESKVADYAFTTLDVVPGMLEYNGAHIQILDLPGLIEGAHMGKGAGTQVASVIRVADLLLFVVDANAPEQAYTLIEELSQLDIKVNKEGPRVMIEDKKSGGLLVESNRHKTPERNEVAAVLKEIGVYNGKVVFYNDISLDELMALLLENAVYCKGIAALNKIDTLPSARVEHLKNELESKLKMKVVPISASNGTNIDVLKSVLFDNLSLMRIYLKPKDGEADFAKPFVLKEGGTVLDVSKGLHSKASESLKYAYVTGSSARFKNQRVGAEHVLRDGDIATLVYESR